MNTTDTELDGPLVDDRESDVTLAEVSRMIESATEPLRERIDELERNGRAKRHRMQSRL